MKPLVPFVGWILLFVIQTTCVFSAPVKSTKHGKDLNRPNAGKRKLIKSPINSANMGKKSELKKKTTVIVNGKVLPMAALSASDKNIHVTLQQSNAQANQQPPQNIQPLIQELPQGNAAGQGTSPDFLGQAPPNMGLSPPNLGLSPPNTGLSPPYTGLSPPNTGLSPPNTGLSPPNLGLSPPHLGFSPPNTGLSPPNLGLSPPNTGLSPPNLGFSPPNTGQPPPNLGLSPPNTGLSPPNVGFSPPNTGLSPPNTGMLPPNTGLSPPNAGLPLPNGALGQTACNAATNPFQTINLGKNSDGQLIYKPIGC